MKGSKHPCASQRPGPAGTNGSAQESSAIFSSFLKFPHVSNISIVNICPTRVRVGAFSAVRFPAKLAWSFRSSPFKASCRIKNDIFIVPATDRAPTTFGCRRQQADDLEVISHLVWLIVHEQLCLFVWFCLLLLLL